MVQCGLQSASTSGSAPRTSLQENALSFRPDSLDSLRPENAHHLPGQRTRILGVSHHPPVKGTQETLDYVQWSSWSPFIKPPAAVSSAFHRGCVLGASYCQDRIHPRCYFYSSSTGVHYY